MSDVDAQDALPSEFFGNVIAELRRHWVDAQARRQGIDPVDVTRAMILGATSAAEVRVNDDVRAAVYVGDDEILDLDEAAARSAEQGELVIRGLVPDVPPDAAFAFFDVRLGYLAFDYQPRRAWAQRHLAIAGQFWAAARYLMDRGGLNAACENLFAAAELATMALLEAAAAPASGHRSRSEWLRANAAGTGLTAPQAAVLAVLLAARNAYRYGDAGATDLSPVGLLEQAEHVERLLQIARNVAATGGGEPV